jgi:hypothetical protein
VTLAEIEGDDENDREEASCRSFCAKLNGARVKWLISEISSKCGSDKVPMRREACKMLRAAVTERKLFILPAFELQTAWVMLKLDPIGIYSVREYYN